jgi:hypothetical protein
MNVTWAPRVVGRRRREEESCVEAKGMLFRAQDLIVRHGQKARLIGLGLSLLALALAGIAPDPWPT